MRHLALPVLLLALAGVLPASAGEWPSGAREAFVRDCVVNAKARHKEGPARHYCECSADRVAAEFSSTELLHLQGSDDQVPAPMQERLLGASSQCLSQLNRQ
ncbi:hypothetical protein [Azotobacter beijerinckii]|uniref:Uncharacterized protein n=1 Tax=Azotobacter beijerinckii TaxID=170623 RepID=A0A1I4AA24_9GAMM|nr:hypothetical protein [Azotobacter beijerinckii]SFA91564.1 hypothetical protein SAMN04244571_00761 [Azotobacter beijerinckii]SFK52629.1 hypothetical protein SAMN04244574_00914 [Azotobacter beijerinckii]